MSLIMSGGNEACEKSFISLLRLLGMVVHEGSKQLQNGRSLGATHDHLLALRAEAEIDRKLKMWRKA